MNIINSEFIKTKEKINKYKTPKFIYFTYAIMMILLSIIFYINKKYNIPFEKLTGDPALNFKFHPFVGILSNIGVLFWCFAASVSYFSAMILFRIKDKKKALFFLTSAIFTSILLIDDFFMFHDFIFIFKNVKILQTIIYFIYGFTIIWYIVKFFKIILDSTYIFLFIAVGFLGLSVITDMLFKSEGLQYFIEDGFKFIGITNWMLYFSITAYHIFMVKLKDKAN